jgi:hypothetical protein
MEERRVTFRISVTLWREVEAERSGFRAFFLRLHTDSGVPYDEV